MKYLLTFAFLLVFSFVLSEDVYAEPEVYYTSVDPASVDNQVDEDVTFDGDCSACSDGSLEYFYWNSTIDSVIREGSSAEQINFVASSTIFTVGDHEMTLQVKSNGSWSEINQESTALLNVKETGGGGGGDGTIDVNFDVTPPSLHLGETARFAACTEMQPEPQPCVDDIEADLSFDWKIQWESDDNDTWNYIGDQESFEYVNFQEGVHEVRLIITNNDDGVVSDPGYQDLVVLPPIPIAVIKYNNNTIGDSYTIYIKEEQDLLLGSLCLNNEEIEIVCDHFWEIWEYEDNGDLLFEMTGKDIVLDSLTYEVEKYSVMMRAEDEVGTVSAWREIIVEVAPPNVDPVADITITYPETLGGLTPEYYQNSELTFDSWESYDSDGDLVAWKWWFNNEIVSENSLWLASFDETGIYQVKLEVQDDNGVWSTRVSSNFKIIVNTPPSISFVITEEEGYYNLSCTISDEEGYVDQIDWFIHEYVDVDGNPASSTEYEYVFEYLLFGTYQPREYCNYYNEDNSLVLANNNVSWTTDSSGSFEVVLWAVDDGGLVSEVRQPVVIAENQMKYFAASFSNKTIDVGGVFKIDFSGTTGAVDHYNITVNYPNGSKDVYEVLPVIVDGNETCTFSIEFVSAGVYPLDVIVIWADGIPQDDLGDWYGPKVYVGDTEGSVKDDDDSQNKDANESNLPSVSLAVTMTVLSLLAVFRRQR